MNKQVPEVKIDKSDWGDGPWMTEPDAVEWMHAGYACRILRHPVWGHLCGYVGVERTHPYYGRAPRDVDLEAHHDVNYAAKGKRGVVCHVPATGTSGDCALWWFGFDCGHSFDLAPGRRAHEREEAKRSPALAKLEERAQQLDRECPGLAPRYRPLAYVQRQTENLAEQLREKGGVPA